VKHILILLISFLIPYLGVTQSFTISGNITDSSSGESLIGASLFDKPSGFGTISNTYGYYSITLQAGEHILKFDYLGFDLQEKIIDLKEDLTLDINLVPSILKMNEVVIRGNKKKSLESTQMSATEMEVKQIKKLPVLMGEVDILKTIQLLPGIQSAGEGNAGFYVRGGGPDQNLILLDEAVVYNASHLFGFFSVFNADAVKNIELIKGGMPAKYGGRLASVLDISMNEGNNKKFAGNGGIGIISSRLTLEGPIIKEKASFIVSGRRTYVDALLRPVIKNNDNLGGTGYYFYDLNTKLNYRFSDKDKIYLSGYFGRDNLDVSLPNSGLGIKMPWGNAISSLRWNHLIKKKLFVNTTATFTDYNFTFEGLQGDDFSFKLISGIRDWTFKNDWSYYPNPRHEIKFGVGYVDHKYSPSSVEVSSGDTEFDTGEREDIFANEANVYIQDDYKISNKLKANIGLRVPYFIHIGPFNRYVKEGGNTVDIITYDEGEKIVDYIGLEPRMSFRYKLNEFSSLKSAFTRNLQFIHLLSFSPTGLPTDLWIPSSDKVKPQIGLQYNLGYFRNFRDDNYETSVEIYYKTLENQIEYREGERPENGVNNNVDNQLTFGDGLSYGAEFFVKKKYGRLTGWVGYTWSKTTRQFKELSEGEEYSARFDRRHDMSIVGSYDLSKKWVLSSSFIFATGNAITLPQSWYLLPNEGTLGYTYGAKNESRMVNSHRLDLSATYSKGDTPDENLDTQDGEKIKRKKFKSSWTFAIYNAYARQNPYFIYLDPFGQPGDENFEIVAKQVSLFSIIPSITWNFNF
jgi:hypothetical protein